MIFISIASPARAGLYIGRYIRTHSGARAQSRRSPWDRVLHALDRSGTGSAVWVALGHPALPLSCQVVVNPLKWPRAHGSFVCRICPQQARPLLSSSHKVWFAGLFISGVELDPLQAQNIQKASSLCPGADCARRRRAASIDVGAFLASGTVGAVVQGVLLPCSPVHRPGR